MEKLIIFYDDTKKSCRDFAQGLEKYENVECRKASDYKNQTLIFSRNCRTGIVFESDNGRVPDVISHVIWRIVADRLLNGIYQAEEQAIADTLEEFSPEFVKALECFSGRLCAGFDEMISQKTKKGNQ